MIKEGFEDAANILYLRGLRSCGLNHACMGKSQSVLKKRRAGSVSKGIVWDGICFYRAEEAGSRGACT